jgi:hypothetical protein
MDTTTITETTQEMDDSEIDPQELFIRGKKFLTFMDARGQTVAGEPSRCLRRKVLEDAYEEAAKNAATIAGSSEHDATELTQEETHLEAEQARLLNLLRKHQKNCPQCKVFPKPLPYTKAT